MPRDPHAGGEPRFEVRATTETHFSWLRTRMSTERTLMSWVRTGTALIGFGFTIFQIAARLHANPAARPELLPEAPRYLGLALIGGGTLALIIAAGEYRWMIRYLHRPEFRPVAGVTGGPVRTPLLPITVLLILFGVFAVVAVLLRIP
jgi:putative membrane protein